MCVPIFTLWIGRKNNGSIFERPRGGNVNTRVVKLQPLKEDGNTKNVEAEDRDEAIKGSGSLKTADA